MHNLSLSCSSKFSEIYHSCELETILTFFAKSSKLAACLSQDVMI